MSLTPSTMLELGTTAAAFSLKDTEGKQVNRDDFKGSNALVIAFICNHCPYVKHINQAFVQLANEYQEKEVAVVAISSNDVENYPADDPEKMAEQALQLAYTFPYLYDETQDVAKAYRAACTPDIFLFDENFSLVYRGQFDDSRPGNDAPVTGSDLRAALDAVLNHRVIAPEDQKPSIGCNIKWKPGNEPDYI